MLYDVGWHLVSGSWHRASVFLDRPSSFFPDSPKFVMGSWNPVFPLYGVYWNFVSGSWRLDFFSFGVDGFYVTGFWHTPNSR